VGVGRRIDIATTRRLVTAALGGALDAVATRPDPVFGLNVPVAVEGIEPRLLTPRETWADKDAYDTQAKRLVGLFAANFRKLGGGAGLEASPRQAAE
jgi:phosphoenolpyruvate carboxykinase (ATP)